MDRAAAGHCGVIMFLIKVKNHFPALPVILCCILTVPLKAQKYIAAGDSVIRGNRLISVRSEPGAQLHSRERMPGRHAIIADGRMSEPAWRGAAMAAPFMDASGKSDETTLRVLYDRENIYLYWEAVEPGGITASMNLPDSVITCDDYLQVNLKPWLPDSIRYARNYTYSIAINPRGILWDAYFDPYLDGFFFSSWDSDSKIAVITDSGRWCAEMIIPFSGLDLYSDPGWKWELTFRHASRIRDGLTRITEPGAGLTVQQGIRVRAPSLVSYYWPRREFMEEIKPDMSVKQDRTLQAVHLQTAPVLNSGEDANLWEPARTAEIAFTDRMGEPLIRNSARARIGMTDDLLCLNLEADGAKSERVEGTGSALGDGMAGQMAGVNGVFIDRALFENECFWVILQPRAAGADDVHQDYYMIIIDHHGGIRGTHYDLFGAPSRSWSPEAAVDLYDTATGWGAEVMIELSSFDLPASGRAEWGLNLFRNRLLENEQSELQAWRYTGNDFLNPKTFGRLGDIPEMKNTMIRAGFNRKLDRLREKLEAVSGGGRNERTRHEWRTRLETLAMETKEDLGEAERIVEQADAFIGTLDADEYYNSVPHPAKGGYALMDVRFIGEYGWAAGAMGTILRTEDGGETWERAALRSDADLYRVDFVDSLHGWAAGGRLRIAESNEAMRHDKRGGYAYIYHTRDGGKTWQCQYGERGRHLFALDFVDRNTGYACGERGILLKTTDGGAHWQLLPTTGTLDWLYGVAFRDEETGFAVGANETVLRTTDGGRTWTRLDAAADRKIYGFRPIYRDIGFNGETGCIVGQNGTVLMSRDSGQSWKPAATFFKSEIRDLADLRRVRFVTPRSGYAVGELGTRIMVTKDGGSSWSYCPVPDREWLRAVWADPGGRVVIAGERGKVLISDDLGLSWREVHGRRTKADLMVLMAHGDDSAIYLNPVFAHYSINQDKVIVDAGVMSDVHSSEYEETYNLEHDRTMWMVGVRTSTNFNEFETGNNGSDHYHFTERLWQGEGSVLWHMVAAIRAYRPDVVITHGGVFGDYDKPGHKLSGRAGLVAFQTSGGDTDHWPELTRLGLDPWQPKKLYHLASESYPATLDLSPIAGLPLKGTAGSCLEYAEYAIRNFQSQGVYHARIGKLCLVKSIVPVPDRETSIFDGLISSASGEGL